MARDTAQSAYTDRIVDRELAWWKRALDVQRPFRVRLQRLQLGFVLDIGCGIGRNLAHLGGHGVGVDHNEHSVAWCRKRGLTAYTLPEFRQSEFARPGRFDSLLIAHVLEHLDADEAGGLLRDYLPYLAPRGRVLMITPQEVGYGTDPTHVRFVDERELARLAETCGMAVQQSFSFPLPRAFGRIFRYNEFWVVAIRQA